MFETLPNPSLDTILIVAGAAFLLGVFWVFALAFIRWRRADERNAQLLQAQLERAFVELRSLHETVTVMSARFDSLSDRAESKRVSPPQARRPRSAAMTWQHDWRRTAPRSKSWSRAVESRDTKQSC